MKTTTQSLVAVLVLLFAHWTQAADDNYYERFSSLLASTNHFGPPLTNATLSLKRFAQTGEIAGVKLGTSMSVAVERWGKPRNLYASCGGGPLLSFGHGSLNFRGERVVRIWVSPNTIPGFSFEEGLTSTDTPAQFAKALGLPDPKEQRELTFASKVGMVKLSWMHFRDGGLKLGALSIEEPNLREAKDR